MDLLLRDVGYDSVPASSLIEEVQKEYVTRYGGRDETPVVDGEFAPPDGVFLVATIADAPVACGGLRRFVDDVAEIKRMYVRADHRGRGLGTRILESLETRARDLGYRRVVLETGTAQPEAMGLYARAGYAPIAPYGHHRCSPQSRCFAKQL